MDSETLEQLYSVESDEFVAERKRLERSLRDEGRAEEAAELAALAKPAVPVFAANRLARSEPDEVAGLIAAGERLTAAHEQGDADALRKEQAELAKRVARLVQRAKLSDTMEQRLAVLLRAAASNPATADQLRRGVLQEELEPASFEALAGMTLAPPKPRPKQEPKPEPAPKLKRVDELESKLKEATKTLRQAERDLRKAEADHERAARRVEQLEQRLADASG